MKEISNQRTVSRFFYTPMDKDNNREHIHIGNIICRKLEENGQKKNWLAEKISYDSSSLCKMLKSSSLHADMILRISEAMNHDFFSYYSSYLTYNQNDNLKKGE
jgi:hypothetical protein